MVRSMTHPRRPDITVWSLARPAEPQPLDGIVKVMTANLWLGGQRQAPFWFGYPSLQGVSAETQREMAIHSP